ncbi:transmembrane protein EpsG [Lachnospiraceae bacterium]|nr:transmembrane protein EpsG [Lachnospiraceae bacterium]
MAATGIAIYILLAVATVLLGLVVDNHCLVRRNIASRQQMLNRLCLGSVFILLFGVSACRLNVGNDYAKYVEFMHLVNCDAFVPTEAGFNLVVKALYGISGFENYLLVFGFFAFFTILLFLAAIYRQADSFAFSFFLFMAFGYYFQSFNTVRYYLALAIAVCAIPLVLRKEWVKFALAVLLGATLHKSILVVLPLYFLASLPWKKWQLGIGAVLCSTFFFMQDFYLKAVVFLYPTYEDTEYLEGGTSLVNIARTLGVLALSLMCYKKTVKGSRRNRFYFYCNLGALVMYVCCSFLPVISRIGYYLTITHIFFLPALLSGIEDKKVKNLFTAGVAVAGILYFGVFILMKAGNDGLRILPYETFMFHDMVPILSDVN